jgi:hypothetical protein
MAKERENRTEGEADLVFWTDLSLHLVLVYLGLL